MNEVNCTAWKAGPAGGGVCARGLGGGRPSLRHCWSRCRERSSLRRGEDAAPPEQFVPLRVRNRPGRIPAPKKPCAPFWQEGSQGRREEGMPATALPIADLAGFDLEQERERLRQGGCCGKPSGD